MAKAVNGLETDASSKTEDLLSSRFSSDDSYYQTTLRIEPYVVRQSLYFH